MYCVITGDIISSRSLGAGWLKALKLALKKVSKGNKWEIFRGDSFQAEVDPAEALFALVYIKACIRAQKDADVRMGVGIGNKLNDRKKLSESSGDAFVFSGEAFDGLKQVNMAFKTAFEDFDMEINIALKLALIAMDNWGIATAEVVKLAMEHGPAIQNELAELSGRTQSSISEALKRARYSEILELDALYRKKIALLINK
ncbi:MAG: transcriptional regulator [Pedobacter sp.]|nr:MAG: transcriptional regulator [Pedobacter sp.]